MDDQPQNNGANLQPDNDNPADQVCNCKVVFISNVRLIELKQ